MCVRESERYAARGKEKVQARHSEREGAYAVADCWNAAAIGGATNCWNNYAHIDSERLKCCKIAATD